MGAAAIAHLSLPARDPRRVADRLAPLIDGAVFPFPVVDGAFIVVARDGSGLALEVLPETSQHHQGQGEPDASRPADGPSAQPWEVQIRTDGPAAGLLPVHAALTTPLSTEEVVAIGREAGWRTVVCERVSRFGVIELWVDDRFMLELLPESEAARYRDFMRPEGCVELFGPSLGEPQRAA